MPAERVVTIEVIAAGGGSLSLGTCSSVTDVCNGRACLYINEVGSRKEELVCESLVAKRAVLTRSTGDALGKMIDWHDADKSSLNIACFRVRHTLSGEDLLAFVADQNNYTLGPTLSWLMGWQICPLSLAGDVMGTNSADLLQRMPIYWGEAELHLRTMGLPSVVRILWCCWLP